jgi:hypothetical protein
MLRSIAIFVVIISFSPAAALPLAKISVAPVHDEALEVRLTKSNACKPKYKHRKAAQDLREKAHCK